MPELLATRCLPAFKLTNFPTRFIMKLFPDLFLLNDYFALGYAKYLNAHQIVRTTSAISEVSEIKTPDRKHVNPPALTDTKYFISHIQIQICTFIQKKKKKKNLATGLSRKEYNHLFKCFAKVRVLILILSLLHEQVYQHTADSTATDSESKVRKCYLLVWMQWEGSVWFDLFGCEEGKVRRAKQETEKGNI